MWFLPSVFFLSGGCQAMPGLGRTGSTSLARPCKGLFGGFRGGLAATPCLIPEIAGGRHPQLGRIELRTNAGEIRNWLLQPALKAGRQPQRLRSQTLRLFGPAQAFVGAAEKKHSL